MTEPLPYREIADVLRQEIEGGTYRKGEKLPAAKTLGARWEVSTTTIHRAFGVLEQDGLVDIRPGSGVYVRSWEPILRDANKRLSVKQWGSGHSIWEADLGIRPLHVETAVSTTDVVPAEVRALLDCARYQVRSRIFTVEHERVQLATSYLDATVTDATAIAEVDTGEGGTFARLKDVGLGPSRFREDVRVRSARADEAKALGLGANRTVIEIVRENATEDGQVVEVTHMILVADAYVLRYHMHS